MTQLKTPQTLEAIETAPGEYSTQKPKKPRAVDLATLDDIRLEMGKLYRGMKTGEIDVNDGSKMAYVLQRLADVTKDCEAQKALTPLTKQPTTIRIVSVAPDARKPPVTER